jgi:flavodoxin
MKEVLIVYYSQTGQLLSILENIAREIEGDSVHISYYEIVPKPAYDCPWEQ